MCQCDKCQCISKQVETQRNNVVVETVTINDKLFLTVDGLLELAASWDELGDETRALCAKELRHYIDSHSV